MRLRRKKTLPSPTYFFCILRPMNIVINICCFYEHEVNVKLTRRAQNTTLTASRITSCSKSHNEFQMLQMWVARSIRYKNHITTLSRDHTGNIGLSKLRFLLQQGKRRFDSVYRSSSFIKLIWAIWGTVYLRLLVYIFL